MTDTISVREFQILSLADPATETKKQSGEKVVLSQEDFTFLTDLQDSKNGSELLQAYYKDSDKNAPEIIKIFKKNTLQIQNYVGAIKLPSGTILEILPKVQIAPNQDAEKQLLIKMITTAISPRVANNSDFADEKSSLMEYIIHYFLQCTDTLIKRGIKKDYVQISENAPFVKGKILFSQDILHNSALRHNTYIQYEDYTQDCTENRLIHTALEYCRRYSKTNENKQRAIRYSHFFDGVGTSENVKDFDGWTKNRYFKEYETIKPITEIIHRGLQPFMTHGKRNVPAVLFPMEILFEKYVAFCLQRHKESGVALSTQARGHSLLDGKFALKPDIVFNNKQPNCLVLDTKWKKVLDYDIKQSDAYQMFGYSQAYNADAVLLYPMPHDKDKSKVKSPLYSGAYAIGCKKDLSAYLIDLSADSETIAKSLYGLIGDDKS